MSEFTGSCYHLVQSNGWCDKCKEFKRVLYTDGETAKEMDYREQLEDEPLFDDEAIY